MAILIDLLGDDKKASIIVEGLQSTDSVTVNDINSKNYAGVWENNNWVFENINQYGNHTVSFSGGSNVINITNPEEYYSNCY